MSSYPPTPAFGGFQLPQQRSAPSAPTAQAQPASDSSAPTAPARLPPAVPRPFKLGAVPAGRADLRDSESVTESLEEGEVSDQEAGAPRTLPTRNGAPARPWPDAHRLAGDPSAVASDAPAGGRAPETLPFPPPDSWYTSRRLSPASCARLPPTTAPPDRFSADTRASRPQRVPGARPPVSSHPAQLAEAKGSPSLSDRVGAADRKLEPSGPLKELASERTRGLLTRSSLQHRAMRTLPVRVAGSSPANSYSEQGLPRHLNHRVSSFPAPPGAGSHPPGVQPPPPNPLPTAYPAGLNHTPPLPMKTPMPRHEEVQRAVRDLTAAKLSFKDIIAEAGVTRPQLEKIFAAMRLPVPQDPVTLTSNGPADKNSHNKQKLPDRLDAQQEAQRIRKQLEKEQRDKERREAETKAAELVRQREAAKEEQLKKERAAQVLAAKEAFNKKLEEFKIKPPSPSAPTPLSSTPVVAAARAAPPPVPATPSLPPPPRIPGLLLSQPPEPSTEASTASTASTVTTPRSTNGVDTVMPDAPPPASPDQPVGASTPAKQPSPAAPSLAGIAERPVPTRRKRPVAADLYSEPAVVKRKFGAQRPDDALIIDISDDEDEEMEFSENHARAGTGSPASALERSRSNGATTNGMHLKRSQTLPNGTPAKTEKDKQDAEDNLRKKEAEIQRLRAAIIAAQKKKQTPRNGPSTGLTPSSTPGIGNGPSAAPRPISAQGSRRNKEMNNIQPKDVGSPAGKPAVNGSSKDQPQALPVVTKQKKSEATGRKESPLDSSPTRQPSQEVGGAQANAKANIILEVSKKNSVATSPPAERARGKSRAEKLKAEMERIEREAQERKEALAKELAALGDSEDEQEQAEEPDQITSVNGKCKLFPCSSW